MKEDNSKNDFMYMAVPIYTVAENIDEYIIPECQEACKELWAKNLFTFMCSNREDGENKYILLGELSAENEEIFKQLMEKYPSNYDWSEFRGTYAIRTYGTQEETSKKLLDLVEPFQMQDVLEGYQTIEDYLTETFGIFKLEPNPDYTSGVKAPKMEDYEDFQEFLAAYDKYVELISTPEYVKVFDKTKMTKSVEEYLQEAGEYHLYDQERGIVYRNEFYRDAHLRYMKYLGEKARTQPIGITTSEFQEAATNPQGIANKGTVYDDLMNAVSQEVLNVDTAPGQGE